MTTRILVGDALTVLRGLPSESAQLCVTSPPYYSLRDYGTATWEGGDPSCDHVQTVQTLNKDFNERWGQGSGDRKQEKTRIAQYRDVCGKCGATRVDRQIGLEKTPAEFLAALWAVFDEVKRVLRPDGLCFVNIGDSYAGSGKGPTGANGIGDQRRRQGYIPGEGGQQNGSRNRDGVGGVPGVPAKTLLLIPQRFAIGMQERGWIVRSAIVWAKTSAMPESTRDRPTSAWEPIFMFSKSPRYYFDQDAVRTPAKSEWAVRTPSGWDTALGGHGAFHRDGRETSQATGETRSGGANIRNVWTLGPAPLKEAHFATFPPEIPRRCILAGTSEKGACPACGVGWVRVVDRSKGREIVAPKLSELAKTGVSTNGTGGSTLGIGGHAGAGWRDHGSKTTDLGWQPSCQCDAGPPRPQTVLDPFLGSGTTLMVADRLGRSGVGIELSPEYARMAEARIQRDAGPLFGEAVTVEAPRQATLFDSVAG